MVLALALLLMPLAAFASSSVSTKEIALGVRMPLVSIDLGHEVQHDSEMLSTWLRLGYRGIDGDMLYQEPLLSALSANRVKREDVFITGKVSDCRSARLVVEQSMRELRTAYIDLLLIHSPLNSECAEAWVELEDFQSKGMLRALGVGDYGHAELARLIAMAKVPPVVNRIHYNILHHDEDVAAFAHAHNITIQAKVPLGNGVLTNRAVQIVARDHNVSAAQVALKWLIQRGHIFSIPIATVAQQNPLNGLSNFILTDFEMMLLNNLRDAFAESPRREENSVFSARHTKPVRKAHMELPMPSLAFCMLMGIIFVAVPTLWTCQWGKSARTFVLSAKTPNAHDDQLEMDFESLHGNGIDFDEEL